MEAASFDIEGLRNIELAEALSEAVSRHRRTSDIDDLLKDYLDPCSCPQDGPGLT